MSQTKDVNLLISYAWNKAYIVKNLCINRFSSQSTCEGVCYLRQTFEQQGESDELPKKITFEVKQNWQIITSTEKSAIALICDEEQLLPLLDDQLYKYLSIKEVFKPPRT